MSVHGVLIIQTFLDDDDWMMIDDDWWLNYDVINQSSLSIINKIWSLSSLWLMIPESWKIKCCWRPGGHGTFGKVTMGFFWKNRAEGCQLQELVVPLSWQLLSGHIRAVYIDCSWFFRASSCGKDDNTRMALRVHKFCASERFIYQYPGVCKEVCISSIFCLTNDKIHEEMQLPSEKLTHWTMIVAAVSSVGLNMWKKTELSRIAMFVFFNDIWVKWSTINLRVAYFQRNLCCFWEISVFELHPHPSRQDGRRREVMTRIPPPPKKEQLHLSLRLYSVDRFWQRWEDKVRWFAGLVLVFWSSVLNSLYHKTQ